MPVAEKIYDWSVGLQAFSPVLQAVEQHGEDDDRARENRLPVGGDADDHQPSDRKPMTKAPSMVPRTLPRPPISEAPPITTAAMAIIS